MIITDEQKSVIKNVMPNVEEWIEKGYDMFMDEFYGLILDTFDRDCEATDISYELEKVYDEIVYQNKKK